MIEFRGPLYSRRDVATQGVSQWLQDEDSELVASASADGCVALWSPCSPYTSIKQQFELPDQVLCWTDASLHLLVLSSATPLTLCMGCKEQHQHSAWSFRVDMQNEPCEI